MFSGKGQKSMNKTETVILKQKPNKTERKNETENNKSNQSYNHCRRS